MDELISMLATQVEWFHAEAKKLLATPPGPARTNRAIELLTRLRQIEREFERHFSQDPQ